MLGTVQVLLHLAVGSPQPVPDELGAAWAGQLLHAVAAASLLNVPVGQGLQAVAEIVFSALKVPGVHALQPTASTPVVVPAGTAEAAW